MDAIDATLRHYKNSHNFLFTTSALTSGLRGSLQRMQLEYVDVVFANRPDSNTPMEGEWLWAGLGQGGERGGSGGGPGGWTMHVVL